MRPLADALFFTNLYRQSQLGELDGLRCQVQQLTISLDNAVTAKEDISKRLGAELERLRSDLADAEISNTRLQESQRKLVSDLEGARARAAALEVRTLLTACDYSVSDDLHAHQGALTAATAANASTAGLAPETFDETKRALSSLMLSHDQQAAQLAQLEKELADKSANVEASRTGLTQAVQKFKEAESRGGILQGVILRLNVPVSAGK